ncbi:hypothetical protein ACA910_005798 [Epithemia clementina (nom. ined.)]
MEVSTPSSQRSKLDNVSGHNDLYLGVLRQVSEMTMEDPVLYKTPNAANTPKAATGGLESIFETPDRIGSRIYATPDQQVYGKLNVAAATDAAESKRKPSPLLFGRKKVRSSSTSQAIPPPDYRVFNAPPLPSSPELSIGRKPRQALPPQFSPIASLQIVAPTNLTRGLVAAAASSAANETGEGELEQSPRSTAQESSVVVGYAATSETAPPPLPSPPVMPWMDTPEQSGGKRMVVINQLKMRKRNLPLEICHPSLPFETGALPHPGL